MSHWPLSAIQGETTHRELLNNALTVCGVQRGASLLGRAMNHPACQFAACLKVKLFSLVCMRCSSLLHRNGNAKRRQDSSVDLSGAVLVWIRSSRMGLCWHQDMRWPQSRSGKLLVETWWRGRKLSSGTLRRRLFYCAFTQVDVRCMYIWYGWLCFHSTNTPAN